MALQPEREQRDAGDHEQQLRGRRSLVLELMNVPSDSEESDGPKIQHSRDSLEYSPDFNMKNSYHWHHKWHGHQQREIVKDDLPDDESSSSSCLNSIAPVVSASFFDLETMENVHHLPVDSFDECRDYSGFDEEQQQHLQEEDSNPPSQYNGREDGGE